MLSMILRSSLAAPADHCCANVNDETHKILPAQRSRILPQISSPTGSIRAELFSKSCITQLARRSCGMQIERQLNEDIKKGGENQVFANHQV